MQNNMCFVRSLARSILGWSLLFSMHVLAREYRFDGSMSEEVLRSYLSRSMTTMYLLTGHGDFDDNLCVLTNCGVKFAGRAVYQWGREAGGAPALLKKLELARANAAKIHRVDPELILQACIFEIVSRDVNELSVPAWAFEGLGRPVERRNFRYEEMTYSSGRGSNQWGQSASVPDVSHSETKLWFYFLARVYIDIGCEAIHYGQAELMNGNDLKLDHWAEVLTQARGYAAKHARRHFILCDAHVPRGGLVRDDKLLFDFHSFPLRIEELPDKPKQAPGEADQGRFWVWGWDEITWFSQQPENARNEWLGYAWKWVREHDPDGFVQMPGMRIISGAADGKRWYDVNQSSPATPNGFGQEQTVRAIWAADTNSAPARR